MLMTNISDVLQWCSSDGSDGIMIFCDPQTIISKQGERLEVQSMSWRMRWLLECPEPLADSNYGTYRSYNTTSTLRLLLLTFFCVHLNCFQQKFPSVVVLDLTIGSHWHLQVQILLATQAVQKAFYFSGSQKPNHAESANKKLHGYTNEHISHM